MPAFRASVSDKAAGPPAQTAYPPAGDKVLIVGLNWLGDSLMAMPAIQAFRRAFPGKRLTMLVKPKLAGLWKIHPAIDEVWASSAAFTEIWPLARQIHKTQFAIAFILPNSFRSALIPFLGGVPERVGARGHFRKGLLTKIISLPENAAHLHQKFESMAIFGVQAGADELPRLQLAADDMQKARTLLDPSERWVGLAPGAARGKAKRWPAEYFSELGKLLQTKHGCKIALFGSEAEQELCARINAGLGPGALNLAGRTSLPELAALFACCSAVIGNDSGGIHLAAAAGAAVVVIFGLTDPAKTRPLGRKVMVIQDSLQRTRDIPRSSDEAEKRLRQISPERVADAYQSLVYA